MRNKVSFKTSVGWAATFSVDDSQDGIHNLLNKDIKYSFKISLMDLVIQSIRPNKFSKELLKYIFIKLDFINI